MRLCAKQKCSMEGIMHGRDDAAVIVSALLTDVGNPA